MFNNGERVLREWGPFMEKNVDSAAKMFDANFHAGMDMFKTACQVTAKADDSEPYRKTRQMWDAAFDLMRANIDVLTRMTNRSFENYGAFCECFRLSRAEPAPKSGTKPSKANE